MAQYTMQMMVDPTLVSFLLDHMNGFLEGHVSSSRALSINIIVDENLIPLKQPKIKGNNMLWNQLHEKVLEL